MEVDVVGAAEVADAAGNAIEATVGSAGLPCRAPRCEAAPKRHWRLKQRGGSCGLMMAVPSDHTMQYNGCLPHSGVG